MRAIFFGTPAIAVPALEELARLVEVAAVVCQPDRPSGRGLQLRPPAVKVAAEALGIPVVQPSKVRTAEFASWVQQRAADFALVIAYGRILPAEVLAAPARGCINLHASILPRWRGAAPITWAVVSGDRTTGISLMQMDAGMDTGPVFGVRTTPIGPDESAGDLTGRLGALAAEVVRDDLLPAVRGERRAEAQDGRLATSARPLSKEDGRIDWTRTSQALHDHVRGMSPWPGAFTTLGNKTLKVLASRMSRFVAEGAAPGCVITADPDAVLVACGSGVLEILSAQLEGKKAHSARELVSGRTLTVLTRLQ
jgi:methionyl-tRNA formyltransferase